MTTTEQTSHSRLIWAPHAWIDGRWHEAVLLQVDDAGHWAEVSVGVACPSDAERLNAPALPGLVDAHSHAFQRAFTGLAERRDGQHDDFWSWRDGMYRVALRISAAQLRVVAAQLYRELLAGGYTHVVEFHYLHHQLDGTRHDRLAEMALALADAAADAGIGLTLLPVLFERAGFKQPALRDDQRRFATSVDEVLALRHEINAEHRWLVNTGVAIHSLRTARPASLMALADQAGEGPIHIHVAEQQREVTDCLAATGRRPIDWLAHQAGIDHRWQLVHATHSEPAEIDAVARRGAGVVLTPGTEANLGDGLCDLQGWLAAGVPLAIGSDSQALRDWPEELRWLEYGQRLVHRRRNVAADPGSGYPSTAARLFERALAGGAAAAGWQRAGLLRGARADLVLVNIDDPALAGIPASHLLDALVFAAPAQAFSRAMVAGRWVARAPQRADAAFEQAMRALG